MTIQALHAGNGIPLAPSPTPPAPSAAGKSELKQAFTDFVGQTFFGELMKQMRSTVDKPAFFHGGMGEDIFQQQLDQIVVERISDSSAAKISDPMTRILDDLDAAIERGGVAYVHCWGGIGRTGTVVGCWLMRHGLEGDDPIGRIAELRRDVSGASVASPQTSAQRAMVRAWKRGR